MCRRDCDDNNEFKVDGRCISSCPKEGQIIRVDFKGDAECICNPNIHLVEVQGKCYQNSTQGICSPGYNMEILRKDEYVCRKNDCQLPNEQLWSDGKCYEKRTEKCSRGLFFILERDKKTSKLVLQCEKDEIDLRSTFSTCLEKSDGTCQTKGVKFEPEIDWSFFRTFSKELYFEETGKGK
ncbi:uncharacterized protein LOC111698965 isoform X5 [Eurytemora carolleeae]|uniref:uncharacterized protein LOC111698965 isoform X5 n=1 Tax=Eurytemora carolleeae TaxID=1294199 RepID=UPI000C78813B|nr:uncharacterized protein LOC111698965 isoform X5 [Eurytemora carolleeae]|eukprot:XP_023325240.1 uncharacterized protein LOC111698965 isoform X5 [Eurytemora affinis]